MNDPVDLSKTYITRNRALDALVKVRESKIKGWENYFIDEVEKHDCEDCGYVIPKHYFISYRGTLLGKQ